MSMINIGISPSGKEQGFSLVELLVTMAIGALIVSGMGSVLMTSRTAFTDEQASAFIQENARYAVEVIAQDLRMAGSSGCGAMNGNSSRVNNTIQTTGNGMEAPSGIKGYEGTLDADRKNFPSGIRDDADLPGDAFVVAYADPNTALTIEQHGVSGGNAAIHLHSKSHPYGPGDSLMIVDSNCQDVGIFQVASNTSTTITHGTGNNKSLGNCTKVLKTTGGAGIPNPMTCANTVCGKSKCTGTTESTFNPGSEVMEYKTNAYYLGDSNVLPGVPALKRRSLSANSTGSAIEELAQGVESLELLFGVDTDDDGAVDSVMDADNVTDWSLVKTVKYDMVFRSQNPIFDTDDPSTPDIDERYLRQQIDGTVFLRNN